MLSKLAYRLQIGRFGAIVQVRGRKRIEASPPGRRRPNNETLRYPAPYRAPGAPPHQICIRALHSRFYHPGPGKVKFEFLKRSPPQPPYPPVLQRNECINFISAPATSLLLRSIRAHLLRKQFAHDDATLWLYDQNCQCQLSCRSRQRKTVLRILFYFISALIAFWLIFKSRF